MANNIIRYKVQSKCMGLFWSDLGSFLSIEANIFITNYFRSIKDAEYYINKHIRDNIKPVQTIVKYYN